MTSNYQVNQTVLLVVMKAVPLIACGLDFYLRQIKTLKQKLWSHTTNNILAYISLF